MFERKINKYRVFYVIRIMLIFRGTYNSIILKNAVEHGFCKMMNAKDKVQAHRQ